MQKHFILISIAFILAFSLSGNAQNDTLDEKVKLYLKAPFVSDGQIYKASITEDEAAEFRATFYAGIIYRIVGLSNAPETKIIFSLYDRDRNLLFCNKEHGFSEFWDFKFNSTMECIIEAKFDADKPISDFVILYIGYKQL